MESLKHFQQRLDLEGSSSSASCLEADKCLNLSRWQVCLFLNVSKDSDCSLHPSSFICCVNIAGSGEGDRHRTRRME